MNIIGMGFVLFWIIVIAAPALIAYLIGIFFILVGMNMLLLGAAFRKWTKQSVRFGNYEIFRK